MGLENKAIIIGRNEIEIEKYGEKGTAYLGKIVMSSGENPVLGRKILMDIAKPHLTLICGKRGGGKSHTMAVLLEELAKQPIEIKTRMSIIVIDTVGIFWSMKYPAKSNYKEINEWDLEPESTEIRFLVPESQVEFYKQKGMPIEQAFTIKASELEAQDWMTLFKVSWKDPEGVLITRAIQETKQKLGARYSIEDIITAIKIDEEAEKNTKDAVIGRFLTAQNLSLFEKEGYKIKDIARPGQITIIDVSTYRQTTESEGTRDIIVSLIGKRLFEERMKYRKEEEIRLIKGQTRTSELPLIWLFIDEAHMFMPKDEKNTALNTLLEWVRVGRQPGLSLVLATQRPDKLHPDCISQCDIFISHRMTSQLDIEAVSQLRPSYLQTDFGKYYQEMPRAKGYATILDDETEKMLLVKIRPRLSWDAGTTATTFRE